MRAAHHVSRFFAVAVVLAVATGAVAADDDVWTVSKSSGDVWLTENGVQHASVKQAEFLKPGDTVRTGKNGRVLLKRGEETMMISPNSVVGLPAEKKEGLSTTILQQAGSVLLEVEKRNVKHFEVETPYLAAVVKGTQFRVTVNAAGTSVDVTRGQVEVADFRSGQIAQVKPGQHATTFANGKAGLSLSGAGTFSPIEQGKPRVPSIERVPVPRAGLAAPRHAAIEQTSASPGNVARAAADKPSGKESNGAGVALPRQGGIRISSAIGEVKLNVHQVTHGLARDKSPGNAGKKQASNNATVWGSSDSGAGSGAGLGNSSNVAASSAVASTSAAASVASTVAAVSGSGGGNGSGDGGQGNNASNGNGSGGSGNNGNGNNGNGNSGNGHNGGNGNHGNGNNGRGHGGWGLLGGLGGLLGGNGGGRNR